MESSIAPATGTATTTASAPVTVARREPGPRSSTLHRLARAIPLIKLAALVVIEVVWWATYARRQLGWRAQGAMARWEHDLTRPRGDRAASSRPRRR